MAKKKVYVGMSGGVDSSLSAALLKEQGYDVSGVFIKVWEPEGFPCTWREDRHDAMRVAAQLDIPFQTLDLSEEYKREVIDEMLEEYESGRTPNPDVLCNQSIKFDAFLNWAIQEGADLIATGHYALIIGKREKSKETRYTLLRGIDNNKDQSYFLWTLPQDTLSKVLFPIGGYAKEQVRTMAQERDLYTAHKKDSQGLCFVGKLDMKSFLSQYIEKKPGAVVTVTGEEIGRHDGSTFYTIGQRHGFSTDKHSHSEKPYYVVAKNSETNELVVSQDIEKAEQYLSKEARMEKMSWVCGNAPDDDTIVDVQVRYRQQPVTATIADKGTKIVFSKPQIASQGQSLVVYESDTLLGGGIIASVTNGDILQQ